MNFEYLIFNLAVLSGPLAMSFNTNFNYYKKWPYVFTSIAVVMVPFIIWDALAANSHWWFNDAYTLSLRIAGLPLGEWFFFITVPFACIFTWESIRHHAKNDVNERLRLIPILMIMAIPAGAFIFGSGKEYTGLVLIFLGITALLDLVMNTNLFHQKITYIFLAILAGFTLIFNGYLTARPVVLYDSQYQLDFRVLTIPIEDFGYGFSLMLLCLIIYEKLRSRYGF